MTAAVPASPTLTAPATLLDLIDRSRVRDVVAVVGFALFTALAAQITIPLGFTPVPITGQTFAVLLAGGVLGANRGALSMGLYVALGAIGLPFYAEGTGGWTVATGATMGYLVGFVVAGYVVGKMAEHGQDRKLSTSLPAFLAGSLIIYGFGATWLAFDLGLPLTAEAGQSSAVSLGVAPFLVGDVLKALLAGAMLPAAWILAEERR
jgi:biotin transport system substrate-specific component